MKKIKNAVAISDISCFGKCALTVTLPMLSSAGIETSILPTALLSTHTGGLGANTKLSLIDQMPPIVEHWKNLGLKFDGVCVGYLDADAKADEICRMIDDISDEETLVLVDPAMADNGAMYRGMEEQYKEEMLKLCKRADVILPNLTEAMLLLGLKHDLAVCTMDEINNIAKELQRQTGAQVVITGIDADEITVCNLCIDREGNSKCLTAEKINGHFHGTGDVFAAATFAYLLYNPDRLFEAVEFAAEFTLDCVKTTNLPGRDEKCGLLFEGVLKKLAEIGE